jgi:hypothetical protein
LRSQGSDIRILLLCAVPLALGLWIFLSIQNTGQSPIPLPNIGALNTSRLPSTDTLLPGSNTVTQTVQDHPVLAIMGSVVTILALVMLAGIVTDMNVARRKKLAEQLEQQEPSEDLVEAPWLGDGEYMP